VEGAIILINKIGVDVDKQINTLAEAIKKSSEQVHNSSDEAEIDKLNKLISQKEA
jgi:hypothetical protein